jgi:hypothetical protein
MLKHLKQFIMNFSISISQTNANGQTTFNANAKKVTGVDVKDVSRQIADFSKDTIETFDKLADMGVKGLSKSRIKNSQSVEITLTAKESVTFSISNFGKVLRDNKRKDVQTIIEVIAVHTDKWANIWE